MLNLWCRKALSTLRLWRRVKRVCRMCWISDAERRWARKNSLQHGKRQTCWISDAERRWARGVLATKKHLPFVLNLWCRKALSTAKYQAQIALGSKCWISDAERRWAQIVTTKADIAALVLNLLCRKALSTVPKSRIGLVGTMCWISDAERRWALQAYGKSKAFNISVESLMPKGVEHWSSTNSSSI